MLDKQNKICLEKRNLLLRGFIYAEKKAKSQNFSALNLASETFDYSNRAVGARSVSPINHTPYYLIEIQIHAYIARIFTQWKQCSFNSIQFQKSVWKVNPHSGNMKWHLNSTAVCAYKCGRPEIYAFFKSEKIHSGKLNSICIKKWQNFIFNRQD